MDNYFERVEISDSNAWQSVSEPVVKGDFIETKESVDNATGDGKDLAKVLKNKHSAPVLTIQLILCLLILIFAFVSKNYFFSTFSNLKKHYDAENNASMYFDGNFSGVDYSNLFGASQDEF